MMCESDMIGGFPVVDANCRGCWNPLLLENAWMTDGCSCNSELGVNSMNETRWRLLMTLQQQQSHEFEDVAMMLRRASRKLPAGEFRDKVVDFIMRKCPGQIIRAI